MSLFRKSAPLLTAAAMVGAVSIPWHSQPSATAVENAASKVSFERKALPNSKFDQKTRPVQPALKHIQPWISAVGASVGSMDVRQQGFPGDACLTDPRDDSLKVFSVPGSKGKPFPSFELRPDGLKYDRAMAPIGCVPADIDQDGRQDLIAYYWGRSPVIFRNVAPPGATPSRAMFRAQELVAPSQVWNTTALNVTDIDGDGVLDILVGNYFPDNARVLDPKTRDDQNMEMQHSMGAAHNAGPNRILLGVAGQAGRSTLKFKDASDRWPAESAKSWTLAMGMQDLTGNGRPDMFVSNDFGPDQLMVNTSTPGDVQFRPVTGRRDLLTAKSKVLGRDSFKGMGVTYSYEPGKDLPRMFVSNITSPRALHESNLAFYPTGKGSDLLKGKVPFKERAVEVGIEHSGWSWDIKPIDANNSGSDSLLQANGFIRGKVNQWPRLQEIAMGNDQILSEPGSWLKLDSSSDLSGHERNKFWLPTDGKFADIGKKAGFADTMPSRGFAVADINDDGRQDFLVANQWGRSYVHVNTSKSQKKSVTLNVTKKAAHGSTPLIGAKVTVKGAGYSRKAELYPANGHSGVSSNEVHFALPRKVIDRGTATVQWTDGGKRHSQTFSLKPGRQELQVSR